MNNMTENLGFWDRIFNRYRKVIHQRGFEVWNKRYGYGMDLPGQIIPNSNYKREWIEYKTIDRVTGSETIERKYLVEE